MWSCYIALLVYTHYYHYYYYYYYYYYYHYYLSAVPTSYMGVGGSVFGGGVSVVWCLV